MSKPRHRLELYIDGCFLSGGGRTTEPVFEPATGEVLGELPHATKDDLAAAVAAAARAFPGWRDTSAYDRARVLRRTADLIRERSAFIAELLTREQGKILSESVVEVAHAADLFEWFAEEGRRTYGRIVPGRTNAALQMVMHEPVGPCAVFTPWNFPALTPARKLAAGLAAGCTLVLKASEETPAAAMELVRALHDAGLPAGAANLVFGVPGEVSETLIADPAIRKISFTGSTAVGKHLLRLAADGVKRTTMELGGNAPVILFEDADIERAADALIAGKFRNAGQVCISPSRFFVHESCAAKFTDAFRARVDTLKVGDGLHPGMNMGPLANARRVEAMQRNLADAEARGGRILTRDRSGETGNYFLPAIVAGLGDDAMLMREEVFGPIVPIATFATFDEVMARANASEAGLAGYVFTRSIQTAQAAARELKCGMVGVNSVSLSMPETPFGGVKQSGHGQEGGTEGLHGFLDVKLVVQA